MLAEKWVEYKKLWIKYKPAIEDVGVPIHACEFSKSLACKKEIILNCNTTAKIILYYSYSVIHHHLHLENILGNLDFKYFWNIKYFREFFKVQ